MGIAEVCGTSTATPTCFLDMAGACNRQSAACLACLPNMAGACNRQSATCHLNLLSDYGRGLQQSGHPRRRRVVPRRLTRRECKPKGGKREADELQVARAGQSTREEALKREGRGEGGATHCATTDRAAM